MRNRLAPWTGKFFGNTVADTVAAAGNNGILAGKSRIGIHDDLLGGGNE